MFQPKPLGKGLESHRPFYERHVPADAEARAQPKGKGPPTGFGPLGEEALWLEGFPIRER